MPYYRRIRDLREDKDLSQAKMGEILSCSQRVYSNYERGDIDIPTMTLSKIADFHNVSVDYLLERTDNPKMNKKEQICHHCRFALFVITFAVCNALHDLTSS